jgi:hypothetical protein
MTATDQVLRWREVFEGTETEARKVRHWIFQLLPACQACADVVLVTNELCTNAILHTASGHGGLFVVEIAWYPRTVRVSVADAGAPDRPRHISDPDEQGRGLTIVRELCQNSGYFGDHRGLLAWADISWSGPGAAPPPDFGDAYQDTIREGLAILSRAHHGVPTWFGHETRQWWAITGQPGARRLVAAATPKELAAQLDAMRALHPSPLPRTHDLAAARAGQRAHAPVPSRTWPSRPRLQTSRLQAC